MVIRIKSIRSLHLVVNKKSINGGGALGGTIGGTIVGTIGNK